MKVRRLVLVLLSAAMIIALGLATVWRNKIGSGGRVVCHDSENRRYSPGAIIRSRERLLRCDTDGRWVAADGR
jgi:hypothetical protein